ncbi:PTS glucitol/sorbitol transporter subunit IIC [Salmonella enterica]|nr:PTS sorbitol transporter subunit IIC [Salmonella enterica subsp. enterica serovar Santiago]EJB9095273.1 PTS glucitol/sorbitol transporter subunit IIC [Salmonella enterica]EBH8969460.1 PTS sorbitol transporter subunit IIC [Salmonella enterica subsp. enterica serovar Santiago]EJB9132433.1 PTS glucitol/sorbitol transporter subunit IIC [Salmonella enterica]EJC0270832.1 PTS glucitol/sorbitol transporter subunit IIC [Salmonella enterica]
MFIISLAEGFIHLFQAAGKIFLDMMSGIIPMLITLLLAINFLMKLTGEARMQRVAALFGRSRILTYGVLPVFGWFFMSSPGALTLGKLLPEKSKPGYEDALGTTAHPLTSLFPHVVPSELFVWLGVAAGLKALHLPVTELALRYIAAAIVIGLIRGIITEYLFLRLSRNDTSGRATP